MSLNLMSKAKSGWEMREDKNCVFINSLNYYFCHAALRKQSFNKFLRLFIHKNQYY